MEKSENAGLPSRSDVCARDRDQVTIHMDGVLETSGLDRLAKVGGLKRKGSEGKRRKERRTSTIKVPLLRSRRRKSMSNEKK